MARPFLNRGDDKNTILFYSKHKKYAIIESGIPTGLFGVSSHQRNLDNLTIHCIESA